MKTIAIYLLVFIISICGFLYNQTSKSYCIIQNTDWEILLSNKVSLKYKKWDSLCTKYYLTNWYYIYVKNTSN